RREVQRLRQKLRTRDDANFAMRRIVQEFEVQQEEIRVQNQQLIESHRLLEESRDRYVSLYDYAPVAYVTLCAHGVIREINRTGRHEADRERRRRAATEASERLLREVLAALPVGVRVLDPHGTIVMSNDVSRRIWGDPTWPASLGAHATARLGATGERLSYAQ